MKRVTLTVLAMSAAVVCLLVLVLALTGQAQQQSEHPETKQFRQRMKADMQAAEAFEAQARMELAERAPVFDLQFEADEGLQFTTFEISTAKGLYRLEGKTEKLLIEGAATLDMKGCYISLTHWGKLVATANLCRRQVEVYSFERKTAYSFYLGGDDEGSEDGFAH
jgi:hypothetical protein